MRRDHSRMALRKVSIPTLRNQVGILTLRRAILEWYRFLLCAEHIHSTYFKTTPLLTHKVLKFPRFSLFPFTGEQC